MPKARHQLPPLTDEEEAAIQAGIAADPDNPEWTAADFKKARPFKEVFPELYEVVEADARRPEGADEAAGQPAARPGRDRPFQGAGRRMADAHQQGVAQGHGGKRSEIGRAVASLRPAHRSEREDHDRR